MPPGFRAVLFDFDLTLADSSPAIVDCFNVALAGLGLPPADPAVIRRTIGRSLPDSLALVAGERLRCRADEFRAHWRWRSDQVMVAGTRLLEPAPQAVRALRGQGLRLGVVSTKWRQRIHDVMSRDGLAEHFELVIGGDDVRLPKPDPEGLHLALERLGLGRSEVVYVGDSPVDGEAAQAAGVAFVAVLSGATSVEELAPFEPLAVLDHVGQAPALLSDAAVTIPD